MPTALARGTLLAIVLLLIPAAVFAQSLDGSIYQVQTPTGAPNIYLFFSVNGQSFITGILTFGAGGNGRWFGAIGALAGNGLSGTAQIIFPSGGALTQPPGSTFQFNIAADGNTGSFSSSGLQGFLSVTSGNFARVF